MLGAQKQSLQNLLLMAGGAEPPMGYDGTNVIDASVVWRVVRLAGETLRKLLQVEKKLASVEREYQKLREENEALKRELSLDVLTRLSNKACLKSGLKAIHAESQSGAYKRRDIKTSCLLMIDLDGFKTINDTYGHEAGDKALLRVADFLRSSMRESDIIARVGGDEFMVLLAGCDEENAQKKAQKLEEGFAALTFEWHGYQIPVRASVGSCLFTPEQTPDAVLQTADKNMYERKKGKGGDRRHEGLEIITL
jgi:diguanylate cyclase (GGDEF)-like protein